jgi:hypothetical protein
MIGICYSRNLPSLPTLPSKFVKNTGHSVADPELFFSDPDPIFKEVSAPTPVSDN